jgi:Acyl-CoA dehydrogenases
VPKGLDTPKLEGKFSLRASVTGQIFMDDVFVPSDKILSDVFSFRGPFSWLNMADMEFQGEPWELQNSV